MPEGKFVELVDENDNVVGKALRRTLHDWPQLHRAVHVWVFNKKGELFLQKRPLTMKQCPGLWDSSCGEHVEMGESYGEAARRGLKEELKLSGLKLVQLTKKIIRDKNALEIITLYKTVFDGKIKINHFELADGKFFTVKEIKGMVRRKKTTPFFNAFFEEVFG